MQQVHTSEPIERIRTFQDFETWRQNNSKVDFGSIENGCAAFDLPPEGQKKERWAISRTVNEITRIYAI